MQVWSYYPWQNKTLVSYYNKLYETDAGLNEIISELVNFKNEPIAGNATIARIKEDNLGIYSWSSLTRD
ncbi:MAG: hypothetical protein WKI04_19570 [Ferruginibacter sp.]